RPAGHDQRDQAAEADSLAGQSCEHGVREPRPRLLRPVAEVAVGQARERDSGDRVGPKERAAAAEVAEGARRVALARPVRALAVAELEAEAPVVRALLAEPGQHAVEARELHARRLVERLARDPPRLEQLARDHEQLLERAVHAGGRRTREW